MKMRRPDLVFRQPNGEIRQVELQSDNDETMNARMLEYYLLLWRQFRQIPLQTLLYVGNNPLTMSGRVEHPRLQFSYDVIDIRQFETGPLLESTSIADNILAVLCHQGAERMTIKHILRNLSHLPGKEQIDRLLQLLILSGLRQVETVIQREVKKMPLQINLMENAFFRDAILEGIQQGEEKGIKKGMRKGMEKGMEKGQRIGQSFLLNRMLEHRFGKLPKWAEQQLAKADATTLETWGVQLLDAKKLEEVVPRDTRRRRPSAR